MQVKIIRIEQSTPDTKKVEEEINKEINELESKNKTIKDVKLTVTRDAAKEYLTTKPYALTAMITYES